MKDDAPPRQCRPAWHAELTATRTPRCAFTQAGVRCGVVRRAVTRSVVRDVYRRAFSTTAVVGEADSPAPPDSFARDEFLEQATISGATARCRSQCGSIEAMWSCERRKQPATRCRCRMIDAKSPLRRKMQRFAATGRRSASWVYGPAGGP